MQRLQVINFLSMAFLSDSVISKIAKEQTLANLSPAEEAKSIVIIYFFCSFVFLFGHIKNILLTELGLSVWENLDLGRWYRPHCVQSVLPTSVKILPCRPSARLVTTNNNLQMVSSHLNINNKISPDS